MSVQGVYIWIWTLHLKIWVSVCTSFETEGGISDSSFGYCIWKFELTSHLGHFIWQFLWGELWNCHSWPPDVSSKVQLPFVTTRCQWQYEIAICNLVISHVQDWKFWERQAFNRFSCFHQVLKKMRNQMRTIKEAIYIRVNDPSLKRNVGKYHLPHVWDEVLANISELKFK